MRKVVLIFLLLFTALSSVAAQDNGIDLPAEVQPFVEKDTKALALEKGDLNGDGAQDFILVLESLKAESKDEQGKRSLLILTRGADDKLTLAKRNDKGLVYCRTCGGVFGDPFVGVKVGKRTFTIDHYGGSAWRWSNSYQFNYSRIDRTWQLVSSEDASFHATEPDKVKTVVYKPPRDFGKIDIADFDPENYLKKTAKSVTKR